MDAVPSTWPNVGDATLVSTDEYCTVLKTLLDVARISMLRVSPSCMVFESDMLFWIVPGPGIELRAAVPYGPAGAANALVLNQRFADPPPAVNDVPGTRSGRSEPAVPRATSSASA